MRESTFKDINETFIFTDGRKLDGVAPGDTNNQTLPDATPTLGKINMFDIKYLTSP